MKEALELTRVPSRELFPRCGAERKTTPLASPVVQWVKVSACNAGLIPGWGIFLWRRNSNPLQYSCLKNPKDRGDWLTTIQRATKSQTQRSTIYNEQRSSPFKSSFPYNEMDQPWVYMCSPSRSPLPPPSPPDPSGSSQCTRSEHLSHTSNLGWWSVSP